MRASCLPTVNSNITSSCRQRCRAYFKAVEARLSCRHSLIMPRQAFNGCCSSTDSLRRAASSSLLLQIHLASTDPTELLRDTFKAFDFHGQGFIARQTLHDVIKAAAPFTTELRMDQVFEAADMDSDGLVSFREFASLMQEAAQLR